MKNVLKKNSTFFYAMSLAASWAWGTSLVVGMETMQSKGFIPFLIWAIANSLAIPLFGFIAYKIPNLEKIVNSKIVNFISKQTQKDIVQKPLGKGTCITEIKVGNHLIYQQGEIDNGENK